MADEESEYERLVALINEVEATSEKGAVSFLDLSEIVGEPVIVRHVAYNDVLEIIEDVENRGKRPTREVQAERARVQEQRRQQVAESHVVTAGVMQTPFAQQQPRPQKQKKEVKPLFAPKEIEAQRKEGVASELGAIASRLGGLKPNVPSLKMKKINVSDLVLPNLSIADQISELERIIEGLKENMFDQDHMQIVAEEVFGLQQVVDQEKKKSKGRVQAAGSLELSMRELRDERLAEAESFINKGGGG